MEDYEEAVEKTITLYADAKPYTQVIYRANGLTTCNVCFAQAKVFNDLDIRNVADLYSEDYELQRKVLVRQNAKVKDVAKLLENGDICYSDACEWCMENDIPLGQFDRCLYNAQEFVKRWGDENSTFGVVKVIQGAKTESVPLGELKKLSEQRKLLFDEQLMQFAMGNCITLVDTNGNRKLYKQRQDQKIDAVAAMMDAYVAWKQNRDAFE